MVSLEMWRKSEGGWGRYDAVERVEHVDLIDAFAGVVGVRE